MNFRETYRLHREAGYSRRWAAVAAISTAEPTENMNREQPFVEKTERLEKRIDAFWDRVILAEVVLMFAVLVLVVSGPAAVLRTDGYTPDSPGQYATTAVSIALWISALWMIAN